MWVLVICRSFRSVPPPVAPAPFEKETLFTSAMLVASNPGSYGSINWRRLLCFFLVEVSA